MKEEIKIKNKQIIQNYGNNNYDDLTQENKEKIILYFFNKSLLWLRVWKLLCWINSLFTDPDFSSFFRSFLEGKKEVPIKEIFDIELTNKELMKLIYQNNEEIKGFNKIKKRYLDNIRKLLQYNALKIKSEKNNKISILLNSESPTLTQIKQLLDEKGLMVTRNSLSKLMNFEIDSKVYEVVEKIGNGYRITQNGKNLWDQLFEKNREIFNDFPSMIEKYIEMVGKIRKLEKKLSNTIKDIRRDLMKINRILEDNFLKINKECDELIERKNKMKKELDEKKEYINIDNLEDEFLEYFNLQKKIKYFEEIQNLSKLGKRHKENFEEYIINLELYEGQLNVISRDLRVMNSINEIEPKINRIYNEFNPFYEEIEDKKFFTEFDLKKNEIDEFFEMYKKFKEELQNKLENISIFSI